MALLAGPGYLPPGREANARPRASPLVPRRLAGEAPSQENPVLPGFRTCVGLIGGYGY
jgi:hypothetical protein